MSSNYYSTPSTWNDGGDDFEDRRVEVKCNVCHGNGYVRVRGMDEADCIECEGYGSVLV